MILTPQQQEQLADRIGELLAKSPIADDIKNALVNKMDQIPEDKLLELAESLEIENQQMEELTASLDEHIDMPADDVTTNLEAKQKEAVNNIAEEFIKNLIKE